MPRKPVAVLDARVVRVTPDMVGGAHEWHEINYWQWPLWKCQRCKMQTKNVATADRRACLPTKKGQCRVCHGPAATKTSVYCRSHAHESHRATRKERPLTDEQILAMRRDKTPYRIIGGWLGVSAERARGIVHQIEWDRRWSRARRIEQALGPCACGAVERLYIPREGHGLPRCRDCRAVRPLPPGIEEDA